MLLLGLLHMDVERIDSHTIMRYCVILGEFLIFYYWFSCKEARN